MTETVVGKAVVGFYPKEKPGMGQALKGELILTNRRFVYIRFLGGKFLTAQAKDYSGNIEEGLKNEGSLEVPLNMITEARTDRTWGTPYLRLRYETVAGVTACSFTLLSAMSMTAVGLVAGISKTPYEQLANAILQLKSSYTAATGG